MVVSMTRCQTNSCEDTDGLKQPQMGYHFPDFRRNMVIVPGRGYLIFFWDLYT